MASSKSNNVATETIEHLEKFIYWLASSNDDPANVMMSGDDIAGELWIELVKGIQVYGHLDISERLPLIRRMLDNRLGELKYRFYLTHRKATKQHLSLDADACDDDTSTVEDWVASDDDSPEAILESQERVQATRRRLSQDALKVFDAMIYGNERVTIMVLTSAIRATAIYKSPTAKILPWHVADALFMDTKEVLSAFQEIRQAYNEVIDGQ